MNSSLPPTIEPNKTYRRPDVHLWSILSTFQATSKSFSLESNASCGASFWNLHNTVLAQKWSSLQVVKKSPVCGIVGGREQFKIDS